MLTVVLWVIGILFGLVALVFALRILWFCLAVWLVILAGLAVGLIAVTFSPIGWLSYLVPRRYRGERNTMLYARDRSIAGLRRFMEAMTGSAAAVGPQEKQTTTRRRWFFVRWS